MRQLYPVLLCAFFLTACSVFGGSRLSDQDKIVLQTAQTARQSGKAEEAANMLRDLRKTKPDNAEVNKSLGYALIDAGHYNEAVSTFDKLISLDPDDAMGYNGRAVALDHLDKHITAQNFYEKAIKLSPGAPNILNNFAMSLILSGRYQDAITKLEPISKSGDQTIRRNLALAYTLNGEKEEALILDRQDMSPQDAEENLRFYEAFAKKHKIKKAAPKPPTPDEDTKQ